MATPLKHAHIIRAYADGHTIQFRRTSAEPWEDCNAYPCFIPSWEFRVKPKKKSPGQVYFENAWPGVAWHSASQAINELGAIAVIEAYKRGELDYE